MIKKTFQIIIKNKKILIPFLLLAIIEGIALYLIYLSPQSPVSKLLAPPIRKFYGEKFLHYPLNFIIMPTIFNKVVLWLNYLPGMFFNAMVIIFTCKALNKEKLNLVDSFLSTLKKIVTLSIIWFATFYTAKYTNQIIPYLSKSFNLIEVPLMIQINSFLAKFHIPNILIILSYLMSFTAQLIFIYALPVLLIAKKNIFKSLYLNFHYLYKLFWKTIIIFIISAVVFFFITIAKHNTAMLMQKFSMEIPVLILTAEIIVLFVLNLFITISTTTIWHQLYQEQKADKS